MSETDMNAEIARRCGWKFNGYHWIGRNGKGVEHLGERIYPAFTDCLNQMARAERTLTHPKRRAAYMDALCKACGGGVWKITTADARTRAACFLQATAARTQDEGGKHP